MVQNTFVVIVDGDGDGFLGKFLTDDILIQDLLQFTRTGKVTETFLSIPVKNVTTLSHTLIADVNGG